MMLVDAKYKIGDQVFLISDEDQKLRIVTAITIRPNQLMYELSSGTDATSHYDFEISTVKTYTTN